MTPQPPVWRTGTKQRRNLYRMDEFRGVMFTVEYGLAAVQALNAYSPDQWRGLPEPPGSPYNFFEHNIYVTTEDSETVQIGAMFTERDAALVVAALNIAALTREGTTP